MRVSLGSRLLPPQVAAALLAAVALWRPPLISAQTLGASGGIELSAGTGIGSLWDDETMLGRGAPVRVSVGVAVGRWRLAGDLDWLRHTRDAGYLASEGNMVGVFARSSYLFRDPSAALRPVLGGGVGVIRSTGELRFSSLVPGPDGRPVPGPTDVSPWRLTRPAFDLHAGLRIRASDRVAVRPEVGWRATSGGSRPETLETPLLHLRTMVNVDVRLR